MEFLKIGIIIETSLSWLDFDDLEPIFMVIGALSNV